MVNTYNPNTVTGDCPEMKPCNTFYHSHINRNDWKFIVQLLNNGRVARIMSGSFEDETYKGRVPKLDKVELKKFDNYLQDVIDRLYTQCLL